MTSGHRPGGHGDGTQFDHSISPVEQHRSIRLPVADMRWQTRTPQGGSWPIRSADPERVNGCSSVW